MSKSAPASPAPQIAAAAAARRGQASGNDRASSSETARAWHGQVDWDAVQQLNEEGYQRWLLLQQAPAPAGPTPPQPPPPAEPVGQASAPGDSGAGDDQEGSRPCPRQLARVDRRLPRWRQGRIALPSGRTGPPQALVVDIDDEPSQQLAGQLGQASRRPRRPTSWRRCRRTSPLRSSPRGGPPRPALATPLRRAAQTFERASSALRARQTDLHEAQRKLAISMASAEEAWAEVRHLENANAGWRQRLKEEQAKDDARDFELRELSRLLAACEEQLALARALLRSLLER